MRTLAVNLVQFGAGPDAAANLARVRSLLAAAPPADLVALPEAFACRGAHEDRVRTAEPIPGPLTARLGDLARETGAWVLGGSLVERDGDRLYNTCVLVDRQGGVRARYRKIHLFEARLDDGTVVHEAETFMAGDAPVRVNLDGWAMGLAICYDVRFPELFRRYAAAGAEALCVPADFTHRTGRDHWDVLLRARAIENQCFVIAPGQCGVNERTGVESHGHSLVADPWGRVLARAGSGEDVVSAALDPESLAEARGRIPALTHRRL